MLIGCRGCTSPDCRGCNMLTLERALKQGVFNSVMNEHHSIEYDYLVAYLVDREEDKKDERHHN